MADNLAITAGTGTTIATDDVGGAHYQKVKLVDATADSSAATGVAANPLQVSLANTGANATPIVVDLGANNDVTVASLPLPTGASTLAEQQSQTTHLATIAGDTTAIETAVQLIDDTVYTDGTGTVTKGIAILGQDGTNPQAIKTDAAGELQVDVLTMPTVTINSPAVTNAGTFAVQESGAALTALQLIDNIVSGSGANISQINGVTPLMGAGATGTGSLRVTAASDSPEVTALQIMDDWDNGASDGASVSGDVAHDSADAGEPVKVGYKAYNQDGTVPGTAVTEGDRVNGIADVYGRQFVSTDHPYYFRAAEEHTTAQTNNELVAAPGAGLSLYVTDVVISNGATAGDVKLVEDTAGTPALIVPKVYLAINGGAVMRFKTPLKLTANKNLGFTSTTVTTHTVLVSGYIAP